MYKKIENFFTIDERKIIIDLVDKLYNSNVGKIYRPTGRKLVGLDDLDTNIINKVEQCVKDNYGKDLIVKDIGCMKFSKEYGTPKLLPHKDDYACQIVFDYQLRTNKKWDLFIEGERVELNDNDVVIFEGEKVAHWREKTVFNDNEYVEMICFNCIGDGHWRHELTENPMSEIEQTKIRQKTFKDWAHIYSPQTK